MDRVRLAPRMLGTQTGIGLRDSPWRIGGEEYAGEECADDRDVVWVMGNIGAIKVGEDDGPEGDGPMAVFDPAPAPEEGTAGADALSVCGAAIREAHDEVLRRCPGGTEGHDGAPRNEAAEGEGEEGAAPFAPCGPGGLGLIERMVGGRGVEDLCETPSVWVSDGHGVSNGSVGVARRSTVGFRASWGNPAECGCALLPDWLGGDEA